MKIKSKKELLNKKNIFNFYLNFYKKFSDGSRHLNCFTKKRFNTMAIGNKKAYLRK